MANLALCLIRNNDHIILTPHYFIVPRRPELGLRSRCSFLWLGQTQLLPNASSAGARRSVPLCSDIVLDLCHPHGARVCRLLTAALSISPGIEGYSVWHTRHPMPCSYWKPHILVRPVHTRPQLLETAGYGLLLVAAAANHLWLGVYL